MNNSFQIAEEITYKDERYVVLFITEFKKEEYALANHIIRGTISDVDDNLLLFKKENNELIPVKNEKLAKKILKNMNDIYGGIYG